MHNFSDKVKRHVCLYSGVLLKKQHYTPVMQIIESRPFTITSNYIFPVLKTILFSLIILMVSSNNIH